MPGSTAEERKQRVLDNIDDQAEVFDKLSKRDMSMGGEETVPGTKTAAQQFGAKGPAVRDGKTPPPEEKKDTEKDTNE